MVRSFICVEIDKPDLISKIEDIISEIMQYKGIRPVKPSQLHLTLKFLGEIPETRITIIKQAIRKINIPPFQLKLEGLGCFPNLNYIRVVWIGITEGKIPLSELTKKIEQKLVPLGFPKEKKPFSPHLTLARIRKIQGNEKSKLSNLISNSKKLEFGIQEISRFILKKSTLTPKGPIYEDLKTVTLTT